MSFQSCPHCWGNGYVGYMGIPCPICKGKCIINEQTGKPPEDKEPIVINKEPMTLTLHPLTKELLSARFEYSPDRDTAIDRMVRAWTTRQAEWLKTQFPSTMVAQPSLDGDIDQAFHLAPKTLEEKFHAIQRKHHRKYPSPEDFWDVMCKEFVKAAEEHFDNQPSGRTVNCSVQLKGWDKKEPT